MAKNFLKVLFAVALPAFIAVNHAGAATSAQTLAQQQEATKAAAAKIASTTTKTAATTAAVTTATIAKPAVVTAKAPTTSPLNSTLKTQTNITGKSASPLTGGDKANNQVGGLSPSDSSNYISGSPTSSQQ